MYWLTQDKKSRLSRSVPLMSSFSIALMLTLAGCEGGETITPVIGQPYGGAMAGGPMAGMPMAGELMAGMPAAGEPMAGMPMAGEPMAGIPMAGMPMAGEPMAGMPMAGMPMAGEPLAGEPVVDCGLYSPQSRADLGGAPLTLFTSSCAGGGCHNMNSPTGFRLSFNAPATPDGFSPEQLDEALSALEPHVIIGQGAESRISSRIIDNHARPLGFNEQSLEYIAVIDWIDNLTPCE